VLVAAPAYLARKGTPRVPTDLLAHDCLLYCSGARVFDEWSFTQDGATTLVRVPGKLQINDGMALVAAAVAGGGVMVIDRLLVAQELALGSLVQLLPDYQLRAGQPVYAVYPARPWLALKTATFIAFLQERLFVSL
jgi:DNA-binding transcriptional LysR family regulator